MSFDDELMKEGLREMVLGLQAENTRLKADVARLESELAEARRGLNRRLIEAAGKLTDAWWEVRGE